MLKIIRVQGYVSRKQVMTRAQSRLNDIHKKEM